MYRNVHPVCLLLLLVAMLLSACSGTAPHTSSPVSDKLPDSLASAPLVPLADPFILYHQGTYYAYGTHAADGIEVYTSTDLIAWRRHGLALHASDSWGGRWFWAPEVYAVRGRFYMYYSADEHICVATSDSPTGPFVQAVREPMIPEEKCIDSSLFIDDDGTPYLTFVRFNDGNNIWIARLEDDLTTLRRSSMRPCIHVTQAWEKVWPRVVEASFLIKHQGVYYLTYSANNYQSPQYGVGCATARHLPDGPWQKYPENPLLQSPGSLQGAGHSALFTDARGDLRIVFHAHRDSTHIHPRAMHIGRVRFEQVGGEQRLRISPDYLSPRWVK